MTKELTYEKALEHRKKLMKELGTNSVYNDERYENAMLTMLFTVGKDSYCYECVDIDKNATLEEKYNAKCKVYANACAIVIEAIEKAKKYDLLAKEEVEIKKYEKIQ